MNESESQNKTHVTEITYVRARFSRRVLANLVDIILFALCAVGLFLGSRAIVSTTPGYQAKMNEMSLIKTESELYRKTDKGLVDVVSYINVQDVDGKTKMNMAKEAVDHFLVYLETKAGDSIGKEARDSYDEFRLSIKREDVPYFIKDGGNIIRNSACIASDKSYYENVYAPFIDNVLQGYLVSRIPGYVEIVKYEATVLILAEIAPAYLLSGILVYVVPPLCFYRSRFTLGKALYQIGLADSRLLVVPTKRLIARCAIFYFGELLLSLFTFGVPYIVSFSLMAFSKKKQGFPDYLLNLHEVDLSKNKLYKSLEEIRLEQISYAKKAVDFKRVEYEG